MAALRGPRLWVLAGVLLAALATAGTYLLVISPARADVSSVRSQVDDATVQQTVLRHRLRDLDATAAKMGDLQAQLTAAQAALPATADTPGLLRRVQAVATASGATVSSVTVKPATTSPVAGIWAVPVEVGLTGTADALLSAATALQSDDGRLATVSSSSLASTDGDAFTLGLVLSVYATTAPTSSAGAAAGDAAGGAGASAAAGAGAGAAAGSATPS